MRLAHAKRRDANEKEIVEQLRKRGVSVMYSDAVDILVGHKGRSYLFELKDKDKCFLKDGVTFRKGAIKESQQKIRRTWKGHYSIVWSLDMILYEIGYYEHRVAIEGVPI